MEFAAKIEEAGADALEINILALQTDVQYAYGSFEQRHIDILSHIKKTVKIPVIMKLGDNLTNPIALIDQLYANGAAAVVLFNRFYQPDINIEKMIQVSGNVFSNEADLSKALRWIGIASAAVNKLDYAASGGIHSPEGVVKAILAGASAVEICSVLYQNSATIIEEYIPLPQLVDGPQRYGNHQPVQRYSERKRPEGSQYLRTYTVLEILLFT